MLLGHPSDMAIGLLAAGAPRTSPTNMGGGMAEAMDYMNKMQQQRTAQAIQMAQQQRLQQEQEIAMQKYAQDQQNRQAMQSGIQGLYGSEPMMTNNMQGSGLAGGQMTPEEFNRGVGLLQLQYGSDPGDAIKLLSPNAGHVFAPSNVEKQLQIEGLRPGTPEYIARGKQLADTKTIEGQQELIGSRADAQKDINTQRGVTQLDTHRITQYADQLKSSQQFNASVVEAENALDRVPDWKLGRINGKWTDLTNSDVQEFKGAANTVVALARGMLAFPAGGFSDADRKFLEDVVGGVGANADANRGNLSRLRRISDKFMKDSNSALSQFYDKRTLKDWQAPSTPQTGLLGGNSDQGVGLLGNTEPASQEIDYRDLR